MEHALPVRWSDGAASVVSKTPKGGGLFGWLSKPKKTTGPKKKPKKPPPPPKKPGS